MRPGPGESLGSAAVQQPRLDLSRVFALEPHGPDTYVGESPHYSWGAIYGGLAVAQGLWAATQTVQADHRVHSLHAYFIRGGDFKEPVRYEVDRVRNGRSFTTRQVSARQSGGAILTLICSFQKAEGGADVQAAEFPTGVPDPDGLAEEFDAGAPRRDMPHEPGHPSSRIWARYPETLTDDPRLHAAALAYLSDLNPMGAIGDAYPEKIPDEEIMAVSLDHAVWFHRPVAADDWILLDLEGHGFVGTRGLATGHVFSRDGAHVATIAQEGLYRDRRRRDPR